MFTPSPYKVKWPGIRPISKKMLSRLIEAGHELQAYSIEKIVDVDHAGDIATAEAFLEE